MVRVLCGWLIVASLVGAGLFFTTGDRLLVTPGLFEFDPWAAP